MKKLFILFILFNTLFSYSQNIELINESIKNKYNIKYIKNNDKIEVFIIDSEQDNNSIHFLTEDDVSKTKINNIILRKIKELSINYYYYIPNTKDLTINPKVPISNITIKDLLAATLTLDEVEKTKLIKSRLIFSSDKKDINSFKKFITEIENDGSKRMLFSDDKLPFYIVRKHDSLFIESTNKNKIHFDVNAEDGFYNLLYNEFENNTSLYQHLYSEEDLKSIKSVDFETEKNLIKLEENYDSFKANDKLSNYSYLGYIGTNFDLVDGVKAKNLFFATNILIRPKQDNIGFYISLYGNRTVSTIDSIPNVQRRFVFDSINNLYAAIEKSDLLVNTQSDNLGAYFSLFLKKFNLTKKNTSNVIYFAPSLEFIWRRTNINMKFLNPRISNVTQLSENELTLELNYYQNFSYNTYEFNLAPIGFWLLHENEKISVRLNMNIGYIGRYLSNNRSSSFFVSSSGYNNTFKTISDVFYTGKLWITESLTGITLQAEINNTLKSKSPFYGVTLSKAFDLEKLGAFFKPINNR